MIVRRSSMRGSSLWLPCAAAAGVILSSGLWSFPSRRMALGVYRLGKPLPWSHFEALALMQRLAISALCSSSHLRHDCFDLSLAAPPAVTVALGTIVLHGLFRRVQVTGSVMDQPTALTRLLLAVSAKHSWPATKMLASVPHDVRTGGHGRKR